MFWKMKSKELKPWQEKVSQRIATVISRSQRGWANWLGKRVNRLSIRGQKVALLVFILIAGSILVYPLTDWGNHGHGFEAGASLVRPQALIPEVTKRQKLPEAIQQRISRFGKYRDSLSHTINGRKALDSLVKSRPGLFDSIRQIETYYQLQLEKQ